MIQVDKLRGNPALTPATGPLISTGDNIGGAASTPARAHGTSTDGSAQPLPYSCLTEQKAPQEEETSVALPPKTLLVGRKESCRSIWCPVCFRKNYVPKQTARMKRLDYRKTRMVTLTFDRAIAGIGEDAYLYYHKKKPVSRFTQNLGRAGIKVEDWTCNMEWHSDGTPHFHMLIQVSRKGKSSQIGQDLIHRCWPYGRIHEYYFKSEKAFLSFIGYFSKTGYLHKDKRHQVNLPEWACQEHWRGKKINRFSSMKHSKGNAPKAQPSVDDVTGEEEKEAIVGKTYKERLSRCGKETNFWIIAPGQKEHFVRRMPVAYNEIVKMLAGQYVAGLGFALEGDPWLLLKAINLYAVDAGSRGGVVPPSENGPPNELVGAWGDCAAPSTDAHSFDLPGGAQ